MEPISSEAQSYPPHPPPPPQRSRKGLWIGLAVGAVVLCLCCIVVLVLGYFFGANIPGLSNFFPSPTPNGLFYNNTSAGLSLNYPVTWQYTEAGDATTGYMIIFASSKDILNNSNSAPQTGAAMVILTNALKISDLPSTIDASSMGSVVDYVATSYFTNISGGKNLRSFTLSGLPAASGIYTMTSTAGALSSAYLIAVLRNDEILVLFGICPQTEWSQHQSTFDSIINSVSIVTH